MHRGIYLGTSAMLVQEKMLDVVGNNLANVDTSGFRARVAVNKSFPEVLVDRVERYTIVNEASWLRTTVFFIQFFHAIFTANPVPNHKNASRVCSAKHKAFYTINQ